MILQTKSSLSAALLLLLVVGAPAQAQQKKGDFEITALASGFTVNFGGDVRSLPGFGSTFTQTSSSQNFRVTGDVGYFITRRHEAGGGLLFSVSHFKDCLRVFDGTQLRSEQCFSDTNVGLGLDAFYRYNFSKPESRGFPFVGFSMSVADVTSDSTGNVSARLFAGYKHFFSRNVALDASVGYRFDVNKLNDGVHIRDRGHSVDGAAGLSFIF